MSLEIFSRLIFIETHTYLHALICIQSYNFKFAIDILNRLFLLLYLFHSFLFEKHVFLISPAGINKPLLVLSCHLPYPHHHYNHQHYRDATSTDTNRPDRTSHNLPLQPHPTRSTGNGATAHEKLNTRP